MWAAGGLLSHLIHSITEHPPVALHATEHRTTVSAVRMVQHHTSCLLNLNAFTLQSPHRHNLAMRAYYLGRNTLGRHGHPCNHLRIKNAIEGGGPGDTLTGGHVGREGGRCQHPIRRHRHTPHHRPEGLTAPRQTVAAARLPSLWVECTGGDGQQDGCDSHGGKAKCVTLGMARFCKWRPRQCFSMGIQRRAAGLLGTPSPAPQPPNP